MAGTFPSPIVIEGLEGEAIDQQIGTVSQRSELPNLSRILFVRSGQEQTGLSIDAGLVVYDQAVKSRYLVDFLGIDFLGGDGECQRQEEYSYNRFLHIRIRQILRLAQNDIVGSE